LEEDIAVAREDVDCLIIGNVTYEIASVYDGKVGLLDLVKSSLKRSAQMRLKEMENPLIGNELT
jgi:hypothetical protein